MEARLSHAYARLSVAQLHGPADAEQGHHETHEDVGAVLEPLAVVALGDDAHDHGREQREQESGFKVREVHGHYSFLPVAISKASTMASTFNRPAVTRNLV